MTKCTGATGDSGKGCLKRWVFKCFLKPHIDDADVTFSGRVFHSRTTATGKSRSPMVERRVRQTTSDDVDAKRRRWRADDWWSSSARYGGDVWCRHLYTRTANLNLMRSGTFRLSQCNCVAVAWCGRILRCRKHKPSSRIQHRLHPLGEMGWNASQRCITIVQPLRDETSDWRTERGTERRILRSWRRLAKQAATVFETCDLIDTSASM